MNKTIRKLLRKGMRAALGIDPDYQDPIENPSERFYGEIYSAKIAQGIRENFGQHWLSQKKCDILDVGCHSGRIAIPLAREGHRVRAVDASRFALKRARAHAGEEGIPLETIQGDAYEVLSKMSEDQFDATLSTEVLYLCRNFREIFKEMVRVTKSGGLVMTSHRTKFFFITSAVARKDLESACFVLNHSEGDLWGSYFNWQTQEELKNLYQSAGLKVLHSFPVGTFTGSGGDGMARLFDLSRLSSGDPQWDKLKLLEDHPLEELAPAGRYLLMIGAKESACASPF